MSLLHKSLLPSERPSFDTDVVRISVLGLIALILGAMLTYDFVWSQSTSSASTPFPRPRPSATGGPPAHAANSLPLDFRPGA
jgi:hypothetical protein